jgi:ADP-heptose:LPS heptosyltransferase
MKLPQSEIKKIAVFRALQLGDLLCSIPALRALHHAFPSAEICLLGMPWAKSLTDRFPHYIHSFKHFPGYPGLPEQPFVPEVFTQFLLEVQEEGFDLVLQMQGNGSIVNPMVQLFNGRYTAGFCLPGDYCPDEKFFLPYPGGIHEVERHLTLMEYLGIPSMGTALEFPLYEKDYQDYDALHLPLAPKEYVCVHPGSRGAWRQWPPEFFAKLANYCSDQGLVVVITGTAEEMEIVNQVAGYLHTAPVIAAGKTNIGTAGVLIKKSRLMISNCTGVSHMAAAFRTPGIVISMDGEPQRWAPMNKEIHHTIDWTKTPDFQLAFSALKHVLTTSLQGDHFRNETVSLAEKDILD